MSSNSSSRAFNRLAKSAGCGEVRSTGNSGSGEHLAEGRTAKYDSSPPTHGEHSPLVLPAGVYSEPFTENPSETNTIYRAVHSLEHGGILIWYDGLSKKQQSTLEKAYRDERKVIVVPYPQLKGDTHVAVTAWGRLADCQKVSTKYIDAFIDRYRESTNAPEPHAAM
jgi:hypothetical protein